MTLGSQFMDTEFYDLILMAFVNASLIAVKLGLFLGTGSHDFKMMRVKVAGHFSSHFGR